MITSSRTWVQLIEYCRNRIEKIRREWVAWRPPHGQNPKPPLDRQFQFASDTVSAILSEMKQGRPLQAMALARILFELTNRLAWASMMPNGYPRLLAYWHEEARKFCTDAIESRLLDGEREREFRNACEKITTLQQELNAEPAPRNFICVLRQIAQLAEQNGGEGFPWHRMVYGFYRDLCRAAHANLVLFGSEWTIPNLGRPVVMHVANATAGLVWAQKRFMNEQLCEIGRQEMTNLVDEARRVSLE